MRRTSWLVLLLITGTLLLPGLAHASKAGAGEFTKASGVIGPAVVWKLPSKKVQRKFIAEWQECRSHSQDLDCIASVMRRGGALPAAIAFTRRMDGDAYAESFRKMGPVDLISVFYPTRANTNQAYFMVNGTPPLVSAEDHLRRIDITQDPRYPAIVKKFPKIMLWQGGPVFKEMQRLAGGGQRFVFAYFLLNGCHACKVGGSAYVAFDFDARGTFEGTKLLRLTESPPE
jgi:hypothetical protein